MITFSRPHGSLSVLCISIKVMFPQQGQFGTWMPPWLKLVVSMQNMSGSTSSRKLDKFFGLKKDDSSLYILPVPMMSRHDESRAVQPLITRCPHELLEKEFSMDGAGFMKVLSGLGCSG